MSLASMTVRMMSVLGLLSMITGPGAFAQAQRLPVASVKSEVASDGLMARAQGLIRARELAKSEGLDLARYELDTFGTELTEDRGEWMFVFICKPVPPPPGCMFMVVVDRRTGKAQLFPGE